MLHMMFARKVRGPQVSRLFYDILFLNKGEAPLVSHGFPIEHVHLNMSLPPLPISSNPKTDGDEKVLHIPLPSFTHIFSDFNGFLVGGLAHFLFFHIYIYI